MSSLPIRCARAFAPGSSRSLKTRVVGVEPSLHEPPGVERAADAWRNELENTPIFLFLAAAVLLLGAASPSFALILFTYVAARTVHTVMQVQARQPARTVAWLIGLGATIWLVASLIGALLPLIS